MIRSVAVALALGLLLATGGTASPRADSVSLAFSQYTNVNKVRVQVFSGAISSGAGGEQVDVLGAECGGRDQRLIGGTLTRPGGGWQVENPSSEPPYAYAPTDSGMAFRARWNGRLSEPVVFRIPAGIWAMKTPGKRAWLVHVSSSAGTKSLAGKTVVLQRFTGGRWIRYAAARLVARPSFDYGPYNHEARFEIPARGLRLRAFIPAASAAPCWLPAATKPWRT